VLLPGWVLPRRTDAAEVIGAALVAKADGRGWRRIAAELGRPPPTVRRWLRAACSRRHLYWLRQRGVRVATHLDPDILAGVDPQRCDLADALTAAILAWRRRFARHARSWALIGAFAGGHLLASD
jgi:acyl transferase domain-containing protein